MATEKAKAKKDPKVVVFGSEVGDEEEAGKVVGRRFGFRRRRGSLTWGLFFVLLGVLFLLSNFNALPPAAWSQILKLWPILIILIGVDTLMGQSEAGDVISSVIGLFLFGTILGVLLFVAAPNVLAGLPAGILNYFENISGFLQLK